MDIKYKVMGGCCDDSKPTKENKQVSLIKFSHQTI